MDTDKRDLSGIDFVSAPTGRDSSLDAEGADATGTEELLSVLFTDLVGSTKLADQIGDQAAADLLHDHNELLVRQFERFSGRVIKNTGDGFLVTFGSVRKSVACAVAIQKAMAERNRRHPQHRLSVRIGINAGEVTLHDDDVHGAAVNAAARIVDKAGPDEVIVAETVKQLGGTAPGILYQDRGRVRLRGFEDRWRLFQVTWSEDSVATAPTFNGHTAFVGREKEQADLRRMLELAVGGQGGMVMIGGEAGVGKTRLSQELGVLGAKHGMRVLTGHCYETEGAPPYIPILEILESALAEAESPQTFRDALGAEAAEVARIMPDLRRLYLDIPPPLQLPPEQERHYLFNSVRLFVTRASTTAPLLLILEDLHWADDPTLLLIQHLAERIAESPVLIVGTHRDSSLDIGESLSAALESLHRKRLVHRISLRALDRQGVTELIRSMAGQPPPDALVQAVYDETEGNAFFVEEVCRYLADGGRLFDPSGRFVQDISISELDVPEGVRLVIGRRLEQLGTEYRDVLASAAVIGRRFSFKLWLELAGQESEDLLDAVDQAERAGLIASAAEGGQARFSFAHELIRQTLVSGLSAPRRQLVHLKIADALERIHAGNVDSQVAEIAHHLSQAGDAAESARTATYVMRAGDRSLDAAAFEDALRLYERAVGLVGAETREGADARRQLGLAQRCLGRWDEALASWDQALAIYESLGDPEAIGHLCRIAAVQLAWRVRFLEAMQMAGRGLAALGDRVTPDGCRLLAMTGSTMTMAGRAAEGETMNARAMAMAEELNEPNALAYATYARTANFFGSLRFRDVVELGKLAEARLVAVGNLWDLASLQGWVTQSLFELGALAECERIGLELAELAGKIGHIGVLTYPSRMAGFVDFVRSGDIGAWHEFAGADLLRLEQNGLPLRGDARTFMGLAEFWSGDWDAALELLSAATTDEGPGALGGNSAMLSIYQAYAGRTTEALAGVESRSPTLPSPGQLSGRGAWTSLFCDIETLMVAGERERASNLYPAVAEAIGLGVVMRRYDFRLVESIAGIAAAAGANWEAAEGHFEAALRQAEELPARLEQAEARRLYAGMLQARDRGGDGQRAQKLRAEARAIYEEMRMPRHVAMVTEN